jgi:glycosyltransferase involved in cell wall biosynthesis
MYRDKTITVVIPCYNEEAGLKHLIPKIPPIVDEILVVDNNSTDNTAQIARDLGANVVEEKKKGYGSAYKCGFRNAKGDIIVTMDGDGTYPPESINLLLYILFEEDVDFISARRWRSKNQPQEEKSPLRLLGNFILSATMASLYFCYVFDSQTGMWVFKKDILSKIKLTSDGMSLSEEIKIEAFSKKNNVKAVEIPIYYAERVGVSKLNLWRDGFYNLFFLFKKRLGLV